MGPAALLCLLALSATPMAVGEESAAPSTFRQSRDDAWWTGPLLAASAATLPQGHFLVARLVGGDQVLVAVLDPFQRAAEVERGEDDGGLLRLHQLLQEQA